MGFWPLTRRVVKDSDIVLLVIDVRMPDMSRNRELERIASLYRKKLVYVFNKIDLVSESYLKNIRIKHDGGFFVSGTKNMGINYLKRGLMIMAKKIGIKEPRIGVVGYPNVGKSAIINALAKRAKAKVSFIAGTTKGIQLIRAGSLLILDSPGVIPYGDSSIMLGVMAAKNPEKIRNMEKVAFETIKMLINYDKTILEREYEIEISEDKDYDIILEDIGRKKGFLLKGGIIDVHRAALLVIRDWQKGKFRL